MATHMTVQIVGSNPTIATHDTTATEGLEMAYMDELQAILDRTGATKVTDLTELSTGQTIAFSSHDQGSFTVATLGTVVDINAKQVVFGTKYDDGGKGSNIILKPRTMDIYIIEESSIVPEVPGMNIMMYAMNNATLLEPVQLVYTINREPEKNSWQAIYPFTDDGTTYIEHVETEAISEWEELYRP